MNISQNYAKMLGDCNIPKSISQNYAKMLGDCKKQKQNLPGRNIPPGVKFYPFRKTISNPSPRNYFFKRAKYPPWG